MKKLLSLSAALLALAASAVARGEYQITKVVPSVVRTPIIPHSGDARRTPRSQDWIEIEVRFQSVVPMTDELTFKYYAFVGGKCLTGEVTHVNIPRGRELYSVMYISPQSLFRLLAGRSVKRTDVQDVGVQILSGGKPVAEKSFKGRGEWWKTLPHTSNMLFNKNETPFAPLYWDRYEAIKPAGH